jgi:hypothetical protein
MGCFFIFLPITALERPFLGLRVGKLHHKIPFLGGVGVGGRKEASKTSFEVCHVDPTFA